MVDIYMPLFHTPLSMPLVHALDTFLSTYSIVPAHPGYQCTTQLVLSRSSFLWLRYLTSIHVFRKEEKRTRRKRLGGRAIEQGEIECEHLT